MKILMLVDQKYPTEHVFLEEVYTKIFKEKGHEIIWVMLSEQVDRLTVKTWNKNKVYVIPTKPNLLSEYLNLTVTLHNLTHTFVNQKFDLVFVRNDPIMGLYASHLANKLNIPFVYKLSHLKSDETIYFAKKGLYGNQLTNYIAGTLSLKLRNHVLKKADLVFAMSDTMRNYLVKTKLRSSKTFSLPSGADTNLKPNKLAVKQIQKKYNLTGKTLVYLGTLIKSRNPYFMFDVVSKLTQKHPDLKLMVVGAGLNRQDIVDYKKYVRKLGIKDNVVFTGRVPRKQVQNYLTAADIGLTYLPPVFIFKMNSLLKLVDYMNASLPVVCNNFNDEQRKIVNKTKCGLCVNHDVDSFSDAIDQLLRSKRQRTAMGKRGKTFVNAERRLAHLADYVENKLLGLIA
ncbi:glycosyltransferase family 4 protein [Candidatus Woesearchaeota archaeon]|jgi:glycosyltransferase involved in cell wall biosynthesis|nr:glycosyltransferase family 4 protein [Candidatus Woesearchaeota archaeon]MBT4114302.1 glycosyltransferase family 4 protein [Candidatus Woesearchaeota archaeon]MBT4248446.1 glycosyltransferase family 4 protein [Candidatus Woesearchaeota archaeon]